MTDFFDGGQECPRFFPNTIPPATRCGLKSALPFTPWPLERGAKGGHLITPAESRAAL